MTKLLIFGGTTESRALIDEISHMSIEITQSVATDYGKIQMEDKRVKLITGRMTEDEMAKLIVDKGIDMVVDATHPYAQIVGKNIVSACKKSAVPRIRLARDSSMEETDKQIYVKSAEECVKALEQTRGNILLTTGSKDLARYTRLADYKSRIYPRVLPMAEAIESCVCNGYMSSHIIAMQGPFSNELNRALIQQFDISVLVTKDSGSAGGFREKADAARQQGILLVVIGRPENREGLTLDQTVEAIKARQGV